MTTTCDCKGITKSAQDTDSKKACRRCGSQPYVLLDHVHLECRSCFLEYCIKKMRSTIGKTQLLKNNDAIVVAYSGGPSSRALLELLKDSIERNTSRREQKLNPSILHIDNRTDLPSETRLTRLSSLLAEVNSLCPEWPLYWTTIDSISTLDIKEHHELKNLLHRYKPGSDFSTVQQQFEQKQTNDHVVQLIQSLDAKCRIDPEKYHFDKIVHLNDKIIQIATYVNDNQNLDRPQFVFTGENATSISNNVMKGVIFGHGDKMNMLAGVTCQYKDTPLIHMRPLRDFSAREIAFYLRLKDVDQPIRYEDSLPYSKIADRTESYLASLDVLHSSTYTTLIGVATRMRPKSECDI